MIAAGVYALLFAGSFAFVSFDFSPEEERPGDMILVDFTEPPVPERPKPPVKTSVEPRVHDVADPEEQTAQVAGKDEVTQTPNPPSLFHTRFQILFTFFPPQFSPLLRLCQAVLDSGENTRFLHGK